MWEGRVKGGGGGKEVEEEERKWRRRGGKVRKELVLKAAVLF